MEIDSSFETPGKKRFRDDCWDYNGDDDVSEDSPDARRSCKRKLTGEFEIREMLQSVNLGRSQERAIEGAHQRGYASYMNLRALMEQATDASEISVQIGRQAAERAQALRYDAACQLQFYRAVFGQICPQPTAASRQGAMPLGTAVQCWAVLVAEGVLVCPFFNRWLHFLSEQRLAGIPRDTWMLFYDFCAEHATNNFDKYDYDGAWPTLMDDFVHFVRAAR
eukprot:TRINITY_DN10760_c0_g1_i1.p1 TRINITY_DN10760_c0_g1~~TRINITY_DN10760_c0_g1_i1.p1  ORF type:complete len:222 (+),score=64.47 TRINITY_DN10760_c0_g1_i1:88-753(+)